MASVTLDRLWINDGSDPSQGRAFLVHEIPTWGSELPGAEIRSYAGGRRRLIISDDGDADDLPLSLAVVSAADVAWLRALRAKGVWVRDPRGLRIYGMYKRVEAKPYQNPTDGFAVSLTVASFSIDESV